MPWTKPYRPPGNQRLSPELYQDQSRVRYITIRAYRNQSPFALAPLSARVIDILRTTGAAAWQGVCLLAAPDHLCLLVSPCEQGVSILNLNDQHK